MNGMENSPTACILIFVKAPELGQVKSRLAAGIGSKHATELYKCFVLDLLKGLAPLHCKIQICLTPPEGVEALQQWLGGNWSYQPQVGANLGERLHHAFSNAFAQGYQRVVVIGSDSPDLPAPILQTALSALQSHDAVIGPSTDGGYYTLGFTATGFLPAVFEGIAWSTETVFATTLKRLQDAQRTILKLPTWYDIDTIATLRQFYCQNFQRSGSQTLHYLEQYRHEIFPGP